MSQLRSDDFDLREFAGKAAIVAIFSIVAVTKLIALTSLIVDWSNAPTPARWVKFAADLASFVFILIVVGTTFFRYQPRRSAGGFEARFSALVGTFLALFLALLPPANITPGTAMFAVFLIAIGAALSAYVMIWLGRSFSLMPQARELVMTGPYSIIRHPLYCAEEIAALGVMILLFSPLAVGLIVIHWCFQLRRMVNEERILRAEFPEYVDYAVRTPRVLPRVWSRAQPR